MSTYQYYEFRSIDRPLTKEEREEVDSWSSRGDVRSNSAVFIYNYSDFRQDEKDALLNYFDALFYIANWGTIQLLFKVPANLVKFSEIKQYTHWLDKDYFDNGINITKHGKSILIEMLLRDEDGFGWIDGEGYLDQVIDIRQDIINGDYRSLYLMWLGIAAQKNEYEIEQKKKALEPIVPNNLHQLESHYKSLIELFRISQNWINVARKNSLKAKQKNIDYTKGLKKLSAKEKEDFLKRLIKGETNLSVTLKQHIASLSKEKAAATSSTQRTIGELIELSENDKKRSTKKAKKDAEKAHLKKMKDLEDREEKIWEEVEDLMLTGISKKYDQAAELVLQINELYLNKSDFKSLATRVEALKQKYPRKSGVWSRLKRKGLM